MDPNAALQELREAYNEVQDGTLTIEDAERFVVLFDGLDNWLSEGGFLPSDWDES